MASRIKPLGKKLHTKTLRIAKKYGAKNVRVFGSFARGEQTSRSDVDFLVSMPKRSTLFDLAGFKIDLEEALQRKVDIVEDHCIKPALRSRILADARSL